MDKKNLDEIVEAVLAALQNKEIKCRSLVVTDGIHGGITLSAESDESETDSEYKTDYKIRMAGEDNKGEIVLSVDKDGNRSVHIDAEEKMGRIQLSANKKGERSISITGEDNKGSICLRIDKDGVKTITTTDSSGNHLAYRIDDNTFHGLTPE